MMLDPKPRIRGSGGLRGHICKVCSAYGVVEYSLTGKGRRHCRDIHRDKRWAEIEGIEKEFQERLHAGMAFLHDSEVELSEEAIASLAQALSDDNIRLTFTKHREISI